MDSELKEIVILFALVGAFFSGVWVTHHFGYAELYVEYENILEENLLLTEKYYNISLSKYECEVLLLNQTIIYNKDLFDLVRYYEDYEK